MADRVTHVLDEEAPEDAARLLSLLLERMPTSQVRQQVVVIGRLPPALVVPDAAQAVRLGRRWNGLLTSGLDLRRLFKKQSPDAILAWGASAAASVTTARPTRERALMVTTLTDPADLDRASRWWDSLKAASTAVDVICSSETVQCKLVESGIPKSATTVIQPGIDFGAIRKAKDTFRRADVGLPETGRVLLTPSPPSRQGGQYYAVWASAILHHVWPDACLMIPGTSREQRRILRLIDSIYCPQIYFPTADRFTPAELLAVSDMLIVPALGDIPTGWLTWAMAAGVPIVASSVAAVTEMIVDRQTGFLCQPGEPNTLATCIKAAAESGDILLRCVEAARTQAYDRFGALRYVDEYLKVIRRLSAGNRAIDNAHPSSQDV